MSHISKNIFLIGRKTSDHCMSAIISENKKMFLPQNATREEEYKLSRNMIF